MRSKMKAGINCYNIVSKKIKHEAITYFSGGKTEPAATELLNQSTLSMKAFTAHPYKNLVV